MLIINADDLGRTPLATDNILACHARGRVTCASAMVFMVDSERSARRAQESGLETGLHLNFSEPFTGDRVPSGLLNDQKRVRRFLKASRYALVLYHPFLARAFTRVVKAQHAEYRRLYNDEPSHFDGHQHLHLATNVLTSGAIPRGTKVRRNFSFHDSQKSRINLWYRAIVDRALLRRHRCTDLFFSIANYLSLDGLQHIVHLANGKRVELMTHPEWPREYGFLTTDAVAGVLSGTTLIGYRDL
jgi:chitin disaccharide deacetylase